MKRAMAWLLAALMLLCLSAAAEGGERPGVTPIDTTGGAVSIDLDGDGAAEAVHCFPVPGEYDEFLRLEVTPAGGEALTLDTEIYPDGDACAADVDGDGRVELFVSGDVMSDDYFTCCVDYADGRLRPLLFADTARGETGDGYFKQGYGQLTDVDPAAGTVTLCGSQDVLGTWFGSRTLKLSPDGLFEYADDGWWRRALGDIDADTWQYAALTLKASAPCTIDGAASALAPGDRILITGSDKTGQAAFLTQDGREGLLSVSEDYERGWGWLVDGIPEDELFEYVPYAD